MGKYSLDLKEYARLAREVAAESCVLLKNDNNIAKKLKNIAKNIAIEFTKILWLIAAGAANPTAIIDKANIEIILEKLLFFEDSNFPLINILLKNSKNIFNAKKPLIIKPNKAKGNRYSTILQRLGMKTAPRIKHTFIDIV